MIPPPYWLNPQLAIILRPSGEMPLEDQMRSFRAAGIDVVVSMLEPSEARELGLEHEGVSANRAGLLFANLPIPDGDVPQDLQRFTDFLEHLEIHIAAGRKVAIHCRASIGRAPLTAASLLIRSGMSPHIAWSRIAAVREYPVPENPNQRNWVDSYMKPKT